VGNLKVKFLYALLILNIVSQFDCSYAGDSNILRIAVSQRAEIPLDTLGPPLGEREQIIIQVFDSLINLDESLSASDSLIESYTIDKSATTYSFKLRSGVMFHDGKKLRSDDVIFTLNRICQNKRPNLRVSSLIAGCESKSKKIEALKIDDLNFQIRLTKRYAPFISEIATSAFSVLPENLNGLTEAEFWKKPIGTGPFKFDSEDQNFLTLSSNSNYFGQKPSLSGLQYVKINMEKPISSESLKKLDMVLSIRSVEKPIDPKFVSQAPYKGAFFFQLLNDNGKWSLREKRCLFMKGMNAAIEKSSEKIIDSKQGIVRASGLIPWGVVGHYSNMQPQFQLSPKSSTKKEADPSVFQLAVLSRFTSVWDKKEILSIEGKLKTYGFSAKFAQIPTGEYIDLSNSNRRKLDGVFGALALVSVDAKHFLDFWTSDFRDKSFSPQFSPFDKLMKDQSFMEKKESRGALYEEASALLESECWTLPIAHVLTSFIYLDPGFKIEKMNALGIFSTKLNFARRIPK
jgi:hypothetical protein